ncbi:MAG TPA: hypothetical protein PLR37_02210 [Candidatus Accumulibacter phosphatis]|nr:hypothetical protein [Candidatus Accumulibacter phosphatis]
MNYMKYPHKQIDGVCIPSAALLVAATADGSSAQTVVIAKPNWPMTAAAGEY